MTDLCHGGYRGNSIETYESNSGSNILSLPHIFIRTVSEHNNMFKWAWPGLGLTPAQLICLKRGILATSSLGPYASRDKLVLAAAIGCQYLPNSILFKLYLFASEKGLFIKRKCKIRLHFSSSGPQC